MKLSFVYSKVNSGWAVGNMFSSSES
jgi:hypothetical protein